MLKTNYAGQSGEIQKRLALTGKGSAIEQVQTYQTSGHPGSKHGYVLYTITELPFVAPNLINTPCSPGYAYAGSALQTGVATLLTAITNNRLTLLGQAGGDGVFCALIEVPSAPCNNPKQ